MTPGSAKNSSRHSLIIFIGLIIFCLGQLTWWIIFQLGQNDRLLEVRRQLQRQRIELITTIANNHFRNMVERVKRAVMSEDFPDDTAYTFLTRDLAGGAYLLHNPTTGKGVAGGSPESKLLARLDDDLSVVYFDPRYVDSLVEAHGGGLVLRLDDPRDGVAEPWLTADMLTASPGTLEKWESESNRRIKMLISEGGFFVLIILFGAFLIYRTIQRSEELKFRQQGFIQGVTHEFRAPLTSLRLYIEALQTGNVGKQKTDELFPKMLDDCDRLDGLIDNVLEAGHQGKSGHVLKLSPTDLAADLNEYLDALQPLIDRHSAKIRREIAGELTVRADYQAFGRVVRALVDNAIHYSPADRRQIDVRLIRDQGDAVLTVTDQGAGLPAAEQQKIFERFYRVGDSETRRVRGTGLGLFLVREIVEAHGGEVFASSPGPNRGTTITVKLPVVT